MPSDASQTAARRKKGQEGKAPASLSGEKERGTASRPESQPGQDARATTLTRTESRPDARIIKTRAALHQALIDLSGHTAFQDLTVTAIARRAGIGYATFFRHYPDKEALLAEVASEQIEDLTGLILPYLGQQEKRAAAEALTRYIDQNRAISVALLVSAGERVRQDISRRAIAHAKTLGMSQVEGLPSEVLATYAVNASLVLIAWWLSDGSHMDAPAMAEVIDRLVLTPIIKSADTGESL